MKRILCNTLVVDSGTFLRRCLLQLDDNGVAVSYEPVDNLVCEPYNTVYFSGIATGEPETEVVLPPDMPDAEKVAFLAASCPKILPGKTKIKFWE